MLRQLYHRTGKIKGWNGRLRPPQRGRGRWTLALLCAFSGVALAAPRPVPAPAAAAAAADRAWIARLHAEVLRGDLDAAWLRAQRGWRAHPRDPLRQAASQLLLRQAVNAHLAAGEGLRRQGHPWQAALQFRTALALDPSDYGARQALAAAMPVVQPLPAGLRTGLLVKNAAPLPQLRFIARRRAFHFDGPAWNLLGEVARAYGLRAFIEKQLPNPPVSFRLGPATLGQCLIALRDQLAIAWSPMGPHTIYFGPSGQRAAFTPLGVRTFYLAHGMSSPDQLAQIAQTLRLMLDLPQLQLDTAQGAIVCRGTAAQLDAAEQLLANLTQPPGQVMLEVRILEVTHTLASQLGISPNAQFQVFSLAPLLAELGQSGSAASLLQNLFTQGGLNGVLNSGQLASQLMQLQQQLSPLLKTPFAIFGGGATLMAVTLPPASANFGFSHGHSRMLENAWMRADSGQQATLRIGERYPVVNASFSPIYLNPALQQVLSNGSYLQPFPSFTYVNLGLDLKIKPVLLPQGAIRMSLNAHVRALTGAVNNNIPILSDRTLDTQVSLRNNRPVLVAGLFTRQEMQSLNGVPGVARLPVIGRLFSSVENHRSDDQLVLVIVPHILRRNLRASRDIWLPADFAAGMANQPPFGFPRPYQPPIYRPPGRPFPGGMIPRFPPPRPPVRPGK